MNRIYLTTPLFIGLFIFLLPGTTYSQSVNLGNPPVLNFSKKAYKAGTQVWSIDQDSTGIMWFANNDGLLEFDGIHWRLHPLSNRTIVRSVRTGSQGRVYVGGQDEFGYFAPEAHGVMSYHSLRQQLPKSEQLGDVWHIMVHREGVFFRTDHQVYRYWNQQVTPLFAAGNAMHFMGVWKGKLIIQDSAGKLYNFENNRLQALGSPDAFQGGTISGILQFAPDTILVTTIKNGIWFFDGRQFVPWKTKDDAFLTKNIVFCASMLSDGKIALGTALNGLITLDRQRRIFQHLNKQHGLQNNTILSLQAGQKGGLWLGLDNGIDFVDINSPFSTIFPDGALQGTGYTVKRHGDKLYFGTNTGLYVTDWKRYYAPDQRQDFLRVAHSDGQVWSLNEIDGHLFMGHHEGAFEIVGTSARKLTNLMGIWKFVSLDADWMVAGHYNGLALFRKQSGQWVFESTLSGLEESSRLLAKDRRNQLWMAHPYRGIFKLDIQPEQHTVAVSFYDDKQGLPSAIGNHLFQVGDDVVFTGEKGVFQFKSDKNRFEPDSNFKRFFSADTPLRYFNPDPQGNIWYATDRETGLLKAEANALEKRVHRVPIPELNNKLTAGFHYVLPLDTQNVFIATDQGFIHFNPTAYFVGKDTTLRLLIQEVRLRNGPDSVLFGGHNTSGQALAPVHLKARQNNLIFAFSAVDHPGSEYIQYSHLLEGSDTEWSPWSAETEVLFSNLNPGAYTFRLKARDQHGIESAVQSFPFEIAPPWYASVWAYSAYVLLLFAAMAGVVHYQHKRFTREKKGLVNLHQEQTRHSQAAIDRLENEKLEAEIRHKNQELASVTLHIVQKSEILNTIKNALERLRQKAVPELSSEIGQILKMLERDARTDDDWEHFSQHFDKVHIDFLQRLGEHFPDLSPNDFKLCVYLRLNLSSKEIATLMNISLRGVESSRYRLRKRLGLDTEANLTEFLMRF